jgi:hypothetical protein
MSIGLEQVVVAEGGSFYEFSDLGGFGLQEEAGEGRAQFEVGGVERGVLEAAEEEVDQEVEVVGGGLGEALEERGQFVGQRVVQQGGQPAGVVVGCVVEQEEHVLGGAQVGVVEEGEEERGEGLGGGEREEVEIAEDVGRVELFVGGAVGGGEVFVEVLLVLGSVNDSEAGLGLGEFGQVFEVVKGKGGMVGGERLGFL